MIRIKLLEALEKSAPAAVATPTGGGGPVLERARLERPYTRADVARIVR